MYYIPNENGKVPEETLAGSNSVAMKTTLRGLHYFKMTLPLLKVHQNFSPLICHFVIYSRGYYEWLCRLRRNIQIGRLLIQTPSVRS